MTRNVPKPGPNDDDSGAKWPKIAVFREKVGRKVPILATYVYYRCSPTPAATFEPGLDPTLPVNIFL